MCLGLAMILISSMARSQNFNYSLVKDSSVYSTLSSPTVLSANEDWVNKQFKVLLPFRINIAGRLIDSLLIDGNGFILLNDNSELAIVGFNQFSSFQDSSQNYTSSLKYEVDGSNGYRIVKLEFSNLSRGMHSAYDFLNYQVWLYESGNKVEFHIGSHSQNQSMLNSSLLGIINRNMDTSPSAFLIAGDLSSPQGINTNPDEEFLYLNEIPSENITFTLTPTF